MPDIEQAGVTPATTFPTTLTIEKTGDDLVVIASTPNEMAAAQTATVACVREKLADAEEDERQAHAVLDAIVAAGLSVNSSAERGLTRARQRKMFLMKVVDALEAGYVIVPNFPGETIAVRVKRQKPVHRIGASTYGRDNALSYVTTEQPQDLPTGEGRYVNPNPMCRVTTDKDPSGKERFLACTTAFQDEIGLPAEFLKPAVIQRTGMCMSRRIFDEIAIVRNQTPRGDPMVVGRLADRSTKRTITFLVAWFIDTRTI